MKRSYPILLLIAAAVIFAFGLVRLFELRYEAGDVYPEYSSMRSDPLGTMALYESLDGFDGLAVHRDISANGMPDGNATTYLYIAFPFGQWRVLPDEIFQKWELFAASGGRLVLTIFPQGAKSFLPPRNTGTKQQEKPKPTPYRDRWGADFSIIDLQQKNDEYVPVPADRNTTTLALPPVLQWHSGVVASSLSPEWQTIYARGSSPVVIERHIGRGSVVIATDSYFLSNEAMEKDRHADLLAWLIGSNRTVVFEETHLGVTETPGIATLMRRYRLQWFVVSLIVLAALFIWKNSVSLVPPGTGIQSNYIVGKDTAAGFINLLRRGIPSSELLSLCFTEWKTAAGTNSSVAARRAEQAQKIVEAEDARPAKDRNPVQAYRDISQILQSQIK
jgi:Domain of unknown function (DUF4350)